MLIILATTVSAQTASSSPKIGISLVNQIPDPAGPGETVDIRFKIENIGGANAQNVDIRLPDRFPFTVVEPTNGVKSIGSIGPTQTGDSGVIVKFTVKINENAAEGSEIVSPEYRMDEGAWASAEDFSISIESQDAIIYVSDVRSNPERLIPGQSGELEVSIVNLADSRLKDVRLTLNDLDAFTPLGTTNQKIIKSMNAGESGVVTFNLLTDADAEVKVHKAGLDIEYLDEVGNSYKTNFTIGLVVDKAPEYLLNLEDTEVYTKNSNGEVVVSISNIGPANIKFLTIEMVPNGDYTIVSPLSVYVGNLESDDFETAEFSIRTRDIDSEKTMLNFRLTYKDDFNQEIIDDVQLPLKIYSSSEARSLGLIQSNVNPVGIFFSFGLQIIILVFVIFMLVDLSKNPMPRYKKALWIVLILTILGAVLYYFMARRKNKRA